MTPKKKTYLFFSFILIWYILLDFSSNDYQIKTNDQHCHQGWLFLGWSFQRLEAAIACSMGTSLSLIKQLLYHLLLPLKRTHTSKNPANSWRSHPFFLWIFSRSSDHRIIFHRSLFWLLMMEVVKGLTPFKMMIDRWTIILYWRIVSQFVKKKSGSGRPVFKVKFLALKILNVKIFSWWFSTITL